MPQTSGNTEWDKVQTLITQANTIISLSNDVMPSKSKEQVEALTKAAVVLSQKPDYNDDSGTRSY